MEDTKQKPNTYNRDEVRKLYPKAGARWEKQEDELLLSLYETHKNGDSDFEAFLAGLSRQFQRAKNGIRGRLAKYHSDIPGWDYEFQKRREQEKVQGLRSEHRPEHNELLAQEYGKYVAAKRETFIGFAKRLSERLGMRTQTIKSQLRDLVSEVKIYKRSDIQEGFERKASRRPEQVPDIDLSENPESQRALQLLVQTNQNIFLTGEAGTGKSTLLQYFKTTTSKNVVVLAPTGVAAVNVGGQTIHSFCGFGPDISLAKVRKAGEWGGKKQLLQKLNTIIIDEISMVRADLLDCVDKFLRLSGPDSKQPFGGIQMVFVGDLYQLPPVDKDFISGNTLLQQYKSPYFFDSNSFRAGAFLYVELKKVYRQKEQVFLEILNAVRNNAVTTEHLEILNARAQTPQAKFSFEKFAVYLATTNAKAKQVNDFFLERLLVPDKTFEGRTEGKFEDKTLPNDMSLRLKIGAQVMMLNNDREKRWVNGTMGKVINFVKEEESLGEFSESDDFSLADEPRLKAEAVVVELETGETVYVYPHTWEMFQFALDKRTQRVEAKTVGAYTQYPLKLAWALTIHKAQGKTFDSVCIDLAGGTFAHGQLYVALSRCRTLQGLILRRPVALGDIKLDPRVVDFLQTVG